MREIWEKRMRIYPIRMKTLWSCIKTIYLKIATYKNNYMSLKEIPLLTIENHFMKVKV